MFLYRKSAICIQVIHMFLSYLWKIHWPLLTKIHVLRICLYEKHRKYQFVGYKLSNGIFPFSMFFWSSIRSFNCSENSSAFSASWKKRRRGEMAQNLWTYYLYVYLLVQRSTVSTHVRTYRTVLSEQMYSTVPSLHMYDTVLSVHRYKTVLSNVYI